MPAPHWSITTEEIEVAINLDLSRDESTEEPELVDLFTLDGETYSIPAKPKVNMALKFLRNVRKLGEPLAADILLEELLGREGYEALTNYDDLTVDQFQTVMMIAQEVVLGQLDGPGKG